MNADEKKDGEPIQSPEDIETDDYRATGKRRGGRAGFLWFRTSDRNRDQVFSVLNIERMAPPAEADDPRTAYIHFRGGQVAQLTGTGLRDIINCITLLACDVLFEHRPGQPMTAGQPVIERMEFWTEASPERKPRHEPETERREKAH